MNNFGEKNIKGFLWLWLSSNAEVEAMIYIRSNYSIDLGKFDPWKKSKSISVDLSWPVCRN